MELRPLSSKDRGQRVKSVRLQEMTDGSYVPKGVEGTVIGILNPGWCRVRWDKAMGNGKKPLTCTCQTTDFAFLGKRLSLSQPSR